MESTNSFVKENILKLKNKTVVATLNQTKGKGTKKRVFKSVPFKTLAFSVLLKEIKIPFLNIIPILTSVCIIKTLKKLYIKNAKIKWFNDITIEQKKLSGILCESEIIKGKANVIVGVGLNINSTKEELNKLELFNATSILAATKKEIKPEYFLNNFIENFKEDMENFIEQNTKEKIDSLIKLYEKNCETIGQKIKVYNLTSKEIYTAKALGINQHGNLLLSKNNQLKKIDCNNFSIFPLNN